MSDDERMQIEGHINFEKNPLPKRKEEEEDNSPEEDDDDNYMQDMMKQQDKRKGASNQKYQDEEPRQPDSETDSMKARKKREDIQE